MLPVFKTGNDVSSSGSLFVYNNKYDLVLLRLTWKMQIHFKETYYGLRGFSCEEES